MGELHSMAYTYTSPSLGWDLQNLGVLTADMSLVMDGTSPFLPHLEYSNLSSGYLEDALLEFSERSKRRRLDDLSKSYWNSSCNWDLSEIVTNVHRVQDEPISTSASSEEQNNASEVKTPSSSSSYKTKYFFNSGRDVDGNDKKKRLITRVVYPFALVKPGGREGDVTLNDINERILMPPTRPVRHPVGDFACRPCVSADGPGLSGKAVVALTRIHTQGRGTITIIRTKG
ncbi:hypothetical protein SLE2022_144070 [Rubroshorea leprosula]